MLFLSIFAATNIAGDALSLYEVNLIGPIGMVLFIAFLAFMIVRFKAFSVKLISAQALTTATFSLIFAILFIRHIENVRYVVIATLVVFFFISRALIKSVKKEIEAREEIEKLAENLKKANAKISEANFKLKELDHQKSEFVSFASHQLRSPMTAMRGYVSMIFEGEYGSIPDNLKHPLKIVYDSTETLINIVEDYLNISRIELGSMKYNTNPIDWGELVKQVVEEQRPNVEKRGLKMIVNIDPTQTYRISADRDKFKQIIVNLIDNSVKYTQTGSITVELKKVPERQTIQYIVTDTGIGISPSIMPKLFQKWARADNAKSENIKGTGLGLFVAKQITEAHKGKIWAESEGEGKGSRFIVELPEVN
jgi:signal transduction histidine kinase